MPVLFSFPRSISVDPTLKVVYVLVASAFVMAGCGKERADAAAPAAAATAAKTQPIAEKPTSWEQRLPAVKVPARKPPGKPALGLAFSLGTPEAVSATNAAVRKAWAWAKKMEPHPINLRVKLDMAGRKHFVEYLALLRMFAAWPGDKVIAAAAIARAHEVLAWTDLPDYHDLARLSDERFNRDSMSYLRAAVLAGYFGWDTAPYLAHIRRVLPRFDAALPHRGIDQQMSFGVLYEKLGLPGAPSRAALYPRSRIAKLTPFPYWVRHPKKVYDFTHEVFAMTGRGAREFPFARPIEQKYARKVAHTLLHIHMTEKNHDAVAELLVNRALLQDARGPQVPVAREFLLRGQEATGRFGHYVAADARKAFKNPKYDVEYGGHIHTTMVSLWALMLTNVH